MCECQLIMLHHAKITAYINLGVVSITKNACNWEVCT